MKRWIVILEIIDKKPEGEFALTAERIRELVEVIGPELPGNAGYKIRSVIKAADDAPWTWTKPDRRR